MGRTTPSDVVGGRSGEREDRILFDAGIPFEVGTREALRMADDLGVFHPYGGLLGLLADCEPMEQQIRAVLRVTKNFGEVGRAGTPTLPRIGLGGRPGGRVA